METATLGSDQYRGTRPMEVHPFHAEHSPCSNRPRCPLPRHFAAAKLNTIVVYVVARWDGSSRRPDIRYEKCESFCCEMKRRIPSSEGAESLNKGIVTLLPIYVLRRSLEAGRHLSGRSCEPECRCRVPSTVRGSGATSCY